jgi:hypothetical protein
VERRKPKEKETIEESEAERKEAKERVKDEELEELREELLRLRKLKRKKELEEQKTEEKVKEEIKEEEVITEREEIVEEIKEKEKASVYEQLLEEYKWLDKIRYEYMYQIPNKEKNRSDYESWRKEWSKVLFDYAKIAVLHILYLRQLYTKKPFSKFEDRKTAVKEIAEKLVEQDLAEWLSEEKDKLRLYWKTLDLWAEEIYDWLFEKGKLEPTLIYEIREADKQFSTLPTEDIKKIFKMLQERGLGKVIEVDEGKLALKIELE